MKVASSTIVAQPFPYAKHLLLIGMSECVQAWKGKHEPMKVWDDLVNGCLLQHDLTDPNAVWIAVMSPGQIPAISVKPGHELPSNTPSF
jgi:hypothetical protein